MFPQNIANDLIRNRLTEIKVVQHKYPLVKVLPVRLKNIQFVIKF